ncbi:elongation factor P--(R)-beta-lysine ligase [Neptunicella sp. SCSIO 80796]|uniref:elongation factor P--(R)-beta-lysine ligase n=1 Tax=Neptunicella plasticusilytica TaxID=3117012 RepID=UPI003A4D9F7E
MTWQPGASLQTLQQRAKYLASIRAFFAERNVLEVETPQLAKHAVTDPHLDSFRTEFVGPGNAQGLSLFLQTSPEYAMKRLLCAGSGCIYQICKAYRNDEAGRLHNPEFTLLEWYRIGFNHFDLMDEMADLLTLILQCQTPQRITYQQAFQQYLDIDPLNATLTQLRQLVQQLDLADFARQETDPDTLLQLLFSHCIEPKIGQQSPCMVYHFPASQAALARINAEDKRVAERFEVYFKGIELANGFHELANANEQRRRFQQDNAKRQLLGYPAVIADESLLQALHYGLPDCAGVALGIDRLLMLAMDLPNIDAVQPFSLARA